MARVRFAILYVLAWTPLAVLYGLVLGSQRNMDLESTIAGTVWTIGSAALLGAIVWRLSTRIHYRRTHLAPFLAIHAVTTTVQEKRRIPRTRRTASGGWVSTRRHWARKPALLIRSLWRSFAA